MTRKNASKSKSKSEPESDVPESDVPRSPGEVIVAPELLAEAIKQTAGEGNFIGMMSFIGQTQNDHLKIKADAGTYTLPEGYDYIVLLLGKPLEGEPAVTYIRAVKGGVTSLPTEAPAEVVGQSAP